MNRLFLIIIAVLLSFSGLFGYLSYSYSEKIGALEAKLTVCSNSNKTLVSDVEKATKACSIADALVKESAEEQKVLEDKREEILSQLDTLPSTTPKDTTTPTTTTIPKDTTKRMTHEREAAVPPTHPVVDIDSALPDDLASLLKQAYRNSIQE